MNKKTDLEKYLFSPKNSHSKESLVNNKLFFDLKLAAAQRGYFLNIYTPEVDKDGFDIILDDQDLLIKVQLKTVMAKTTTRSWKIHKSLLRPNPYMCEQLGFEFSPSGTGYQGGVILIEIEDSVESGFQVKYFYTDIIIICGLRDEIIKIAEAPKKTTMETFMKRINEGTSHDRISIYRNMFLEAKNPASLLALIGMHNNEDTGGFRIQLQKLVKPCNEDELPSPPDSLAKFINEELEKLSNTIIS